MLASRVNRKNSLFLDVQDVVVNHGGQLGKQGIRRLHSMGISHSYSKHNRMDIGKNSAEPLFAYNRQRELSGASHAHNPPPFLRRSKSQGSRSRPRAEQEDDGKKDEMEDNADSIPSPSSKRLRQETQRQADPPVDELQGSSLPVFAALNDRAFVRFV